MTVSQPAGTTLALAITFTVIAVIFSVLRLYSRAVIVRAVRTDDILLGLSILSSIALTALIIFQAYNGLGKHEDTLATVEIWNFLKGLWSSTIAYSLGMMFTQTTFLFQYRNFFVGKWLRRATDAMIVIVTLFGIASTVTLAIQCLPTRYIWDPYSPPAKCINYVVFWFFSSLFNTVTSIVVWALPLRLVNSLHLPKRQKHWLLAVFALGFFTCLASGLRIRGLYISVQHADDDTSYYYPSAATWSSLEINVGIICACVPPLKPMVDRLFPNLLHGPPQVAANMGRVDHDLRLQAGPFADAAIPLTDKSLGTGDDTSTVPTLTTPRRHSEIV